MDRYGGLVWSLARRYLHNRADAEEAVQDIFMDLWTSAGRFDPRRAEEVTFVSMLARRRLIDRVRRLGREPEMDALDVDEPVLATECHRLLEASVDTNHALNALERLSVEQQEVIRLATVLGLSHAAVAAKTGQPLGTVKSHLRRGLLRIRDALGEGGDQTEESRDVSG